MPNIRPLNAQLQEKARVELNEVESRIGDDLNALRSWITKQPHLKGRTNDQFLIVFLRGCKYSLEKAKTKYDYYYTLRTMMPEIFKDLRIDQKNIELCRAGVYVRLPKPLGSAGPRIQLTNFGNFDVKRFNIVDFYRFQALLMTSQVEQCDNCIISGIVEVIDLSHLSFTLITQMQPTLIKKMGVFADKAGPQRLKGVHIINCPKEAQAVLSLARTLMSDKIQSRFYIHKSLEELYQHVPKEYLPAEYGGTNGTMADILIATEKMLLGMGDYFEEEQLLGVNEKLRPGRQIDPNTIFGIDGSFRKLNID